LFVCYLYTKKNIQVIFNQTGAVFFHQIKSQNMMTNISEIKERNKDKSFDVRNFFQEPIPFRSILFNKKVGN